MKETKMSRFDLFHALTGSKEPEYRGHIVDVLREGDHWVAHYALPDDSTPEYRSAVVQPKVRCSGGFLRGPYKSEEKATEAAHCAVDENLIPAAIPHNVGGLGICQHVILPR
jgi:hypothetical protein